MQMIIYSESLGTVHTHTHTHTQVIYKNKKQVINDKINIYNQTGILYLYEDTG